VDATDRIETAIEKLTAVSIELKSMLAVHEERLNRQEKTTGDIQITVEKRREELDTKLKDVYDTMRDQDNNILREIANLREESQEAHKQLTNKIGQLERFIWMAVGGGMVLTWVITNLAQIFKIVH
jgi:gas vesicle protein